MTKKTKALEVEVLPPEESLLAPEFAVRLENAYLDAVQAMQKVLTFGILCIQAKEAIPHGKFKIWIEENCPRISYRSARQFRQLTEAIISSLDPKMAQLRHFKIEPEKLFSTPRNQLPPKLGKFRDTLEKVIEHKSQYQLELEFGVRKPKKGQLVGKGDTNNPAGKNGSDWMKDPIECEKRAWNDFFGSKDIAMIDDDSFLGTVRSHRRSTFWHHLPVAARHKIAEELIGLSNEIQSTYQETLTAAKKAKKASTRKK